MAVLNCGSSVQRTFVPSRNHILRAAEIQAITPEILELPHGQCLANASSALTRELFRVLTGAPMLGQGLGSAFPTPDRPTSCPDEFTAATLDLYERCSTIADKVRSRLLPVLKLLSIISHSFKSALNLQAGALGADIGLWPSDPPLY
jgi:hypothetical protein